MRQRKLDALPLRLADSAAGGRAAGRARIEVGVEVLGRVFAVEEDDTTPGRFRVYYPGPAGRGRSDLARGKSGFPEPIQADPKFLLFSILSIPFFVNSCYLIRIPFPPEGRTRRHGRWIWDAMDVVMRVTMRMRRGRQRRVVLAPLGWC
jgi:hypothetical protein